MTLFENVSVHEYTTGPREGQRFLKFGKGESSGADIKLPSSENDIEGMQRMKRERVLVWALPEAMTRSELKDFLDEERPVPVWEALDVDEEEDDE